VLGLPNGANREHRSEACHDRARRTGTPVCKIDRLWIRRIKAASS
jgi:hypothetical protein